MTDINREGWLTEAAKKLEPIFTGFAFPQYRVTCGWPSQGGLGNRRKVIGQCWGIETSKAGVAQVFISPVLDKPLDVAGTLAHEMVHVLAGTVAAHAGMFVRIAKQIGLTKGKPTSAGPGPALEDKIRKMLEPLGAYPHTAVHPTLVKKMVKRSTVRAVCLDCGCKITIGIRWVEEAGLPTCGCGGTMEDATPVIIKMG